MQVPQETFDAMMGEASGAPGLAALLASTRCGLCQQPARGFATIGDVRYCHEGESPTCYERAGWGDLESFADDMVAWAESGLEDTRREWADL